MNKKVLSTTILAAAATACWAVIHQETHHFKRRHVSFTSSKLPPGATFTIMQISDLHNHVFGFNNEQLTQTVESVNADIIVLTGDMIDKGTNRLEHVFSLVEKMTARHPHVLFVSGNHEWKNGYTYSFFNGLRKRNVMILENQNIQITKRSLTVNIVGVGDPSIRHDDLDQAFQNLTEEPYTILLSHSPGITEIDPAIPADLILSGHTHGGQVRFPFIGALTAPGQGLFPKLTKGTYKMGPDRYLYIDSGLGTSRLPIRFLNPSQLSLITITGE